MHSYGLDNLIRCSASFVDVNGTIVDPDALTFTLRVPGGVTITYTYGTDPEVVKDGEGLYHSDISASVSGEWWYRWQSTGLGQASQEEMFFVRPSQVGG